MHRVTATIKKEFWQFSRDRMLILLILWTYTVEVVLCTYALSFEVNNLHLVVYDQDRSQISQRLIERFISTEYFALISLASGLEEIDNLLDAGKADIGMVIPPHFSDKVRQGEGTDIQIILGGTNSNTANTARGYANAILERFSQEMFREFLLKKGERLSLPEVVPRVRIWYNPELKFRYFMIISMIVVAGFLVGVIHIAATMVREKDTGTLEQLIVTPSGSMKLSWQKSSQPSPSVFYSFSQAF